MLPYSMGFLLLQATGHVSGLGRIVTHLIVGIVTLKETVELIINRHMGHTVHLTLGAGMYNTSKQPFYISNP